jgi:purine-binding chemotaxis protein CheW
VAPEKEKDGVIQIVVAELAKEEYGIPLMQVQEIIQPPEITRIPHMPEFVEGAINLRGKILPLVDLRKRFRLEKKEMADAARVIVVDIEGFSVGLVADAVADVIRLAPEAVDTILPVRARIDNEFISGIGKLDKRIIILLNIAHIFGGFEKFSPKRRGPDGAGAEDSGGRTVPGQ